VPLQAEEVALVIAETRTSTTLPPPAPATTVEEGEAATEATITQAALEASFEAGPSVEGVVVVLDEDSVPLPASESHDGVATLALESAQVQVATSFLLAVEVLVPSPAAAVQSPLPTVEVVGSSLV
jgi:hypothetical protein